MNRKQNKVFSILLWAFLIASCILSGVLGYMVYISDVSVRKENQQIRKRLDELEKQVDELTEKVSQAGKEEEQLPFEKTVIDEGSPSSPAEEYLPEEMSSTSEMSTRIPMMEMQAGDVLPDPESYYGYEGEYFLSNEIMQGDAVYNRIYGKSYVDNEDIQLSDLRYLRVLHYNFDGNIQVGEIIVNAAVADQVLEIFRELYNQQYQIYQMRLIDDFWPEEGTYSGHPGNEADNRSCVANNTSCFCYRPLTGGGELSKHAMGKAIDVNPVQNPYVEIDGSGIAHVYDPYSEPYMYESDRDNNLSRCVHEGDVCYNAFMNRGCSEWGGRWYPVIDYQHFQWN